MDTPTYSIVIATAFNKRPLLETCVKSILEFSTPGTFEIIVVANGCTDDAADWALTNGCVVVPFEEAIGYPKAVNAGIEAAKGEFVVLLNNDTKILGPNWLEMLRSPFANSKCAVTGPMKERCAHAGRDFILFFCAMIRREVIEKVGMLDEIFSPGYSEDVDFCARAQDAGYHIAQVPDDESHDYYGENRRTGEFPIFHAGNQTFKDHPDSDLITRNAKIVAERYGGQSTNTLAASFINGAISGQELHWLAAQAKNSKIIIECGSLFGRSTRVLADNMPEDGVLYAIDTWRGSEAEPGMRDHAALLDGDQDFNIFTRNLWEHIASGRVVPLRMHGRHAAQLLHDMQVRADLVFLDAGHLAEEVKEDIRNFAPLVSEAGILSGHDYYLENEPAWIQVRRAVDAEFFKVDVEGTIWSTRERPRPNVFDCFIFNNELDILERRLATMWDAADRFVVVEGTKTHSGKPKELVFHNNLKRFERFLSKITYIVVEDWPPVTDATPDWSWVYERYQRDAIMRGLTACKDNDIVVISDCDEIPNPEAIKNFQFWSNGLATSKVEGIAALEMELYVYDDKTKAVDPWREARIVRYGLLKKLTPCGVRYTKCNAIPNGGVHLSYQGGVDAIIEKIGNTAHQELNTAEFRDRAHVERCVRKGVDLFKRSNIKFQKVK